MSARPKQSAKPVDTKRSKSRKISRTTATTEIRRTSRSSRISRSATRDSVRTRRVTRSRLTPKVLFPSHSSSNSLRVSEEIRRLAEAVQSRNKRDFMHKWNFDISEGKPLEGDYKWETSWHPHVFSILSIACCIFPYDWQVRGFGSCRATYSRKLLAATGSWGAGFRRRWDYEWLVNTCNYCLRPCMWRYVNIIQRTV